MGSGMLNMGALRPYSGPGEIIPALCFIFCFSSCDVFLWDGIVSVVVVVIPGSTSQKRLLFVLAAAGDRVRVPSGNYFETIVCAFRACRGIGRTETRKRKRGFLEKRRFARRFEEQ